MALRPRSFGDTCKRCGQPRDGANFYCKKCHREKQAEYERKNPGRRAAAVRRHYEKNADSCRERQRKQSAHYKIAALLHYGTACACCGVSGLPFLTIDHIEPRGRRSAAESKNLYLWLKRHNYPGGFQTLCWNCNMAKRDGSRCPHQEERAA